ncbi:MAG: hypothetical protein M1832_006462 [Thelocarpon impressellum]|nr:MAG: hypothetical protein M1832_006462 [Thelocarpon impressellum]
MRPSARLLAALKPARFLTPNAPTGLTGLYTHAAPRSTLVYLYSSTLDALKPLPESSVYRKSTEALTRHRLALVEATKPPGYDEWAARARKTVEEHPDVFSTPAGGVEHDGGRHVKSERAGRRFVTTKLAQQPDERLEEWDGEPVGAPELEGTRTTAERADQIVLGRARPGVDLKQVEWEAEPSLEASQCVPPLPFLLNTMLRRRCTRRVTELESQLGAGLLEEVIQVAEGELKLVKTMAEARVWEDLEEKPAAGQWTYFSRDA